MSDTPTNPEPAADAVDGGAAVEIPAEWEGMTDDEKDAAVEDMLTDVADRAGIEGTADDPEPDEEESEPRRFTDPDSVAAE